MREFVTKPLTHLETDVLHTLNDHSNNGGRWMTATDIAKLRDADRLAVVITLRKLGDRELVIRAAGRGIGAYGWSITTTGAAACTQMQLGEVA